MPTVLFLLGGLVCLGLGAGFFKVAAMRWLRTRNCVLDPTSQRRFLRPRRLLALGLACVVLGSLLISRWNMARSNERTDEARVSASLIDILKTDKVARLSRLHGYQRGPKDVQPTFDNPEPDQELSAEQVKDACRIIAAINRGDLTDLRATIAGYSYRPYARAQLASSLSYVFYLADVDLRCNTHEKWFYIGDGSLRHGGLAIVFTSLNDEPTVQLTAEDRERPGVYQTVECGLDAHAVLAVFQRETVRKVRLQQKTRALEALR